MEYTIVQQVNTKKDFRQKDGKSNRQSGKTEKTIDRKGSRQEGRQTETGKTKDRQEIQHNG